MKRPSFQFYPGDWLRDTALKACGVAARGLWVDMLCLMHEGIPYGHLRVNSKVIDPLTLARMVGGEVGEVKAMLKELEDFEIFSRDKDGAIYSRRMVRDEKTRELRAEGGKLGGSPDLGVDYNLAGFVYAMQRGDGTIKLGISSSPEKRAYRLRKSLGDDSIKVIRKRWVSDMGKKEAELHAEYKDFCEGGEWFKFTGEELALMLAKHFEVQTKVKVNQTPSSSSSSSTALNKTVTCSPVAFPLNLDNADFRQAWIDWMDYRAEQKYKPLKPRSIAAKLTELSTVGAAVAIDAIRYSIANGYQGLDPAWLKPPAGARQSDTAKPMSDSARLMVIKELENELENLHYKTDEASKAERKKIRDKIWRLRDELKQ